MRKALTALGLVLVLVAAGCGNDDDGDDAVASSGTTEASGGGGDVEGRPVQLTARGFAFDPARIDAEPGEVLAITYRNEDGTTHTFTSTDPEVGETIEGGDEVTFSVTVPESGTIEYQCAIHPSMTGTIGAGGGSAAGAAPTSSSSSPPAASGEGDY